MIRLSLHPGPASETSAFNRMRAFNSRRAGPFPLRISASSRWRSSALKRTMYFFTEISFLAMILSAARIVAKANHPILSTWLKRATRLEGRVTLVVVMVGVLPAVEQPRLGRLGQDNEAS